MRPRPEGSQLEDAAEAWLAHYAAVSSRRPRRPRTRSRRVVILGHKVQLRMLLAGLAIAVAAGGALLAAFLATS